MVNFVRLDEGRELVRSHEINKMLVEEFNIVMQTTAGNASHLNGCTERGHRTDGDMVRLLLYSSLTHFTLRKMVWTETILQKTTYFWDSCLCT